MYIHMRGFVCGFVLKTDYRGITFIYICVWFSCPYVWCTNYYRMVMYTISHLRRNTL